MSFTMEDDPCANCWLLSTLSHHLRRRPQSPKCAFGRPLQSSRRTLDSPYAGPGSAWPRPGSGPSATMDTENRVILNVGGIRHETYKVSAPPSTEIVQ